jgi:hypothetical protein
MFGVYDIYEPVVMSFVMLAMSSVVLLSVKSLKIELQNFSCSAACSVFAQNYPEMALPSLHRDFA